MGRTKGVTERQLLEIRDYRGSDAFTELEKRVLDYAVAMSRTPVEVSDELAAALRAHLDEGQMVELTAMIAWENYRARFNRALAIEAQGFSEGAVCAVPERRAAGAHGASGGGGAT